MRQILAVLGLVATMAFSVTSPAEAGEIPPTVQFDKAWTVAGGAAVEVAYLVTCPDPGDQAAGYRHALSTNYGYLEFRCGPEPTRVVMLLQGKAPAKRAALTLNATVYTAQCFYFDSSELENGEQGCWKVSRTDTVRPKHGRFVPESSVDIGAHLDVTDVKRAPNGGVRLTAAFSCVGTRLYGYFTFEVRQGKRSDYAAASASSREVSCDDESFTRSFVLPPGSQSRPFRKGPTVVAAEWVESFEGGPWAWDTDLYRLRPAPAS